MLLPLLFRFTLSYTRLPKFYGTSQAPDIKEASATQSNFSQIAPVFFQDLGGARCPLCRHYLARWFIPKHHPPQLYKVGQH
jgi:hypothetical protein